MIDPKNLMTELTVRLSVSDLAMLERIATTERRRPQDMFQLIFAAGLDCEFCDQMITVVKKEDEYSAEDRAQQKKNEELEKGDINFWDNQRHILIHAEERAIVNNHTPCRRRFRRKFFGRKRTAGKQSDIGFRPIKIFHSGSFKRLIAKAYFFAL